MEKIELNPIEEIEVRICNFEQIIEVCKMELEILMTERERLLHPHKIGFTFGEGDGKNKGKTTRRERKQTSAISKPTGGN